MLSVISQAQPSLVRFLLRKDVLYDYYSIHYVKDINLGKLIWCYNSSGLWNHPLSHGEYRTAVLKECHPGGLSLMSSVILDKGAPLWSLLVKRTFKWAQAVNTFHTLSGEREHPESSPCFSLPLSLCLVATVARQCSERNASHRLGIKSEMQSQSSQEMRLGRLWWFFVLFGLVCLPHLRAGSGLAWCVWFLCGARVYVLQHMVNLWSHQVTSDQRDSQCGADLRGYPTIRYIL